MIINLRLIYYFDLLGQRHLTISSEFSTPKGQVPKRVSFAVTPRLKPVFTPMQGVLTLCSCAQHVWPGFPPVPSGVNLVNSSLSSSNATEYKIAEHTFFRHCIFIMTNMVIINHPESLLVFPTNSTMTVKRSINGPSAKTVFALGLLYVFAYVIQNAPAPADGMIIAYSRTVNTGEWEKLKIINGNDKNG